MQIYHSYLLYGAGNANVNAMVVCFMTVEKTTKKLAYQSQKMNELD
jgi:hypothetical protein